MTECLATEHKWLIPKTTVVSVLRWCFKNLRPELSMDYPLEKNSL